MSARNHKRAVRALKERQVDFERTPNATNAFKRPGSLNPRKSHGGRQKLKKR
jgi:hypothetical protein